MPLGPGAGSEISGNARLIAAARALEKPSRPASPPHSLRSGRWAPPGGVSTGLAQRQDEDPVPQPRTSRPQCQRPAASVRLHPDTCGKDSSEPAALKWGPEERWRASQVGGRHGDNASLVLVLLD